MEKSEIKDNILEDEEESDFFPHKYNLYQQFFVISFDPKIMYNINEIDLKNVPEPLSLPKVISKYPNVELPYLNVPDTIIASHCFPQGIINALVDYEEKDLEAKINKTESFIFYLENMCPETNICSLNISKVYYICLLFYENIENYRSCINQRKIYKNLNVNDDEKRNKGLLIPKVICLSSFCPFYEETKSILHRIKNYVDNFNYNKKSIDNINIYPIEKIIEGLIFSLPSLPRGNCCIKLNKKTFSFIPKNNEENPNNNSKNLSLNENTENNNTSEIEDIIFKETPPNKMPRNIVNYSILMYYFKVQEIFEIIRHIILEEPILFFSENKEVLTNIITAFISLIYPLHYPYPVITILPEQNFSFISVFKHFIFGINIKYSEEYITKKIILDGVKFIRIIKLEKRFNDILNIDEPDNLGISIFPTIKADENKPIIKIDENGGNGYENDKEDSRKINEKKGINLPRHYFEKCVRKLEKDFSEKIKEAQSKNKNKKLTNTEKANIFNNEIKENLLYFFSCIFLKYQDFCVKYKEKKIYEIKDKQGNSYDKIFGERDTELDKDYYMGNIKLNKIFKCKEFIDSIPSLDRPFYRIFVETKVFFNFIYKKTFPDTNQEKLDVLYFDELINKKLARESRMQKIETKFLEYDYEESDEVEIFSLKKIIDSNFNKYLQNHENRAKALNYFQFIYSNFDEDDSSIDEENVSEKKDQIYFYYYVFPVLLNDGIFYKEKKENSDKICNSQFFADCIKSSRLFDKFEKESFYIINDEEINKNYKIYDYSLNPTSQFHLKNEYMIKILWLRYLSKTFHIIPISKKKYYFEIMMLFLKENKNIIDERTILILFNSINKYGDRSMNQDYFIHIKNKTYTSYLCLREKAKPENNFIKYILNQENINNNNNNTNNINVLNYSSNISQKNLDVKIFDKNQQTKTTSKEKTMIFKVNYFCHGKGGILNLYQNSDSNVNTDSDDNNICNETFNEKISELSSDTEEYLMFKCNICFKEQRLSISCEYDDEEDNRFIIDFELLSPMTLLKQKWFQNHSELEPSSICEDHLEPYLSAIFYFYDLDLPCDFLMPNGNKESELKEIRNISYANVNSQEIYDKKDIDRIIIVENKKEEENIMNNNHIIFMEGEDEGDKKESKEKNLKSCFKSSLKSLKQKTGKNVDFKLD